MCPQRVRTYRAATAGPVRQAGAAARSRATRQSAQIHRVAQGGVTTPTARDFMTTVSAHARGCSIRHPPVRFSRPSGAMPALKPRAESLVNSRRRGTPRRYRSLLAGRAEDRGDYVARFGGRADLQMDAGPVDGDAEPEERAALELFRGELGNLDR
jgi:hypothetical protein